MWQVGVCVCLGWIVSLCLHEFGHAIVAYWGGDTSVKDKGYLTLNPLKYTEPGLSLFLPIIFLIMGGIGLPGGAVYIESSRLRNRFWKSAVSIAGPLANILVTILLAVPFWLGWDQELTLRWFLPSLAFLAVLELFAVIVNLLPIPALDGYGIIQPWLPTPIQNKLNEVSKYGIWILVGLFWFSPQFSLYFWGLIFQIIQGLGIPLEVVRLGATLFDTPVNKLILILGLVFMAWGLQKNEVTWFNKGNQFLKKQQYQKAIEAYDQALKIKPDYYDAWYNKAYCFYQLGSLQEALQTYDQSISIKPNEINPLLAKADILAKLNRISEQSEIYEQIIQLSPDTPDYVYQQGYLLEQINQDNLALEKYQKVLEIDPNFYQAWYNQGEIFKKMGKFPEAVQAYDRVLELRPNDVNTWFVKARTLEESHNYQEALASYDQAIRIDPSFYRFWFYRGSCYYHLHQYQEAVTDYKKTIELNPSYADAWYNQACCYALQNQIELSLECLREAIKLDPERFKHHAKIDADLVTIHSHPEFLQITQE